MKMKIKIPALFLAALLALSVFAGCNSLPPAENPSNSVSAESSPLTEEELEHLRTVREAVYDHMAIGDTANGRGTIQFLQTELEKKENNPEYWIYFEAFRKEVASDPERDEYPSLQTAEKLQQGMFINEVREVLGRPHGTTFAMLNGRQSLTNTYTAYVLENGQILFLRFIQASIKDYSQEELESRISDFNEKDWEVRETAWYPNIGWFKLQEIKVLDLEEFKNTAVGYVDTPLEELPDEYKNGGGINYG